MFDFFLKIWVGLCLLCRLGDLFFEDVRFFGWFVCWLVGLFVLLVGFVGCIMLLLRPVFCFRMLGLMYVALTALSGWCTCWVAAAHKKNSYVIPYLRIFCD